MATASEIVNRAAGTEIKEPPQMDENHWNTLQELLTAIGDLPGVMEKVDAYMRGRGIEDPQEEICELRRIAF
jgi:hypothetical protein